MRNEPRSVFGNFQESESPASGSEGESAISNNFETAGLRTDGPILLQEQIDIAVARSFLHRFIARLWEYPTPGDWAWLNDPETRKAVSLAAGRVNLASPAAELLSAICASDFESFLDAHLSAFGHAARGPVPLNEIEYGDIKADPLFQPHRLADLAAFYHAFGLEITPDASERQDHICLQLEFMSVLAAKDAFALEHQLNVETMEVGRAAQKAFLREHLGRWAPAFARRVERTVSEPTLRAAARLMHAFILVECARLGVKPGSEELVLRPVDDDSEQLCASCGLRDLPPGAGAST